MSQFVIHYAGALEWRSGRKQQGVTTVSAGYAACCTGLRAKKIQMTGANTLEPAKVTCAMCRRNMVRAGVLAPAKKEKWRLIPAPMRDKLVALVNVPYSVREAADHAEMMLERLEEAIAGKCRHCSKVVNVGCNCCSGCAAKRVS